MNTATTMQRECSWE